MSSLTNTVFDSINPSKESELDMEATIGLMVRPTDGVLNDVQVRTAIEAAPKSLSEMEAQRKTWETNAYRTSNKQLYAVLADCMTYGRELDKTEAKQRAKELEEFFKLRGYVVKNDSPLMTRVVKAVFGNVDRRRISTYSLVLRQAQKEGITAAALPDWIEARGGIQEVRLARSASYKSPKQRAEAAKSSLSSMPTLAVAKDKLALYADGDFIGAECVLLAEQQADGSFHIKALTRSGTAVNAALAALYSEQQKTAA